MIHAMRRIPAFLIAFALALAPASASAIRPVLAISDQARLEGTLQNTVENSVLTGLAEDSAVDAAEAAPEAGGAQAVLGQSASQEDAQRKVTIRAKALWEGADPPTEPIRIALLCDGLEIDQAVITQAHGWEAAFGGLESSYISPDGEEMAHSYEIQLKDLPLDGYKTTVRLYGEEDGTLCYVFENTPVASGEEPASNRSGGFPEAEGLHVGAAAIAAIIGVCALGCLACFRIARKRAALRQNAAQQPPSLAE